MDTKIRLLSYMYTKKGRASPLPFLTERALHPPYFRLIQRSFYLSKWAYLTTIFET